MNLLPPQTLVFLRGLLHRGIPGPHLVVAPLSTIDNWANEAERWCGNMNVIQLVVRSAVEF